MFRTILFIVLGASAARAEVAVDSANLRALVEAGNATVQAKRLDADAGEARRGSLGRSFLPQITAGAGGEHFRKGRDELRTQPEYGVEARVNLWNGGRDALTAEIRDLAAEGEKAALRRVTAEKLSDAYTLYWRALYLRDWVDTLKKARALNDDSLRAADRRIRSGVATRIDRLEFEMQAADLGRGLRAAELAYEIARDELALLLGVKEPLALREKFEHGHDYEKDLTHAEGAMDYWTADARIAADRLAAESRRDARGFWPRVEAVAGYWQLTQLEEDPPDAADRTEAYVGLKLRLDLSAGFEEQREARAKRLEAEGLKLRSERDRRAMALHMRTELRELKRLHDQVHDFEENIGRAETYHRMTLSEYGRGVKNSPDVLGANLKLLEARQKRLESIRDFQIAKSHLKAKLGR